MAEPASGWPGWYVCMYVANTNSSSTKSSGKNERLGISQLGSAPGGMSPKIPFSTTTLLMPQWKCRRAQKFVPQLGMAFRRRGHSLSLLPTHIFPALTSLMGEPSLPIASETLSPSWRMGISQPFCDAVFNTNPQWTYKERDGARSGLILIDPCGVTGYADTGGENLRLSVW